MRPPETRYAANGTLAYQALGQGAFDLVFVPGFVSNLELQWEDAGFAQFARRLAAFARLIIVDKRGSGLSDRRIPEGDATLDLAADDICAVLEATGSGRAALLGAFDGALIVRHFAARFPARTRSLALYAPMAPKSAAPLLRAVDAGWGRGDSASMLAPEQANDPRFRAWWARFERLSSSPSEAAALLRRAQGAPTAIAGPSVPAICIHRSGDIIVPIAHGRAEAETLPGVRFVELPGRDHLIWSGDVNRLADTIEEFLTGSVPVPVGDRVLAALLVAHIVNPERLMLRLGEARWQDRRDRFATAASEAIVHQSGQYEPGGPTSARGRFDSPGAAVRAAVAVKELAQSLDLPVAIGLNVGEVDKDQRMPAGRTAFVAEEIASQAEAGEILATRVIGDLLGNLGQSFFDHEPLRTGGMTGPVHVVSVHSPNPMEPIEKSIHEPDLATLSAREREVLKLVAEGLSNGAIASALRLSEHTVKRHVANILMKLDLPTRAAAAVLADKLPA